MTLASPRRSNRRLGAGLGAILALTVVTTLVVAGCGSSSSSKAAASTTGRTAQVLATVRRGNLVDSVTGRVQLTSTTGKAKGTVQVTGSSASQVAAGQSVTMSFFKLPAGVSPGAFGSGSARPSAAPSAGSGGQGYYGSGNGSNGGQGFFGQGGQGGQGVFRGGKTAQGTVTAVSASSNGAVTATVAIAKLPAGVTTKYMGIAQIQVKVLASNVLIIPTAAIKGSGSSATVQLLVNGKTTTQSVTVGQQTQTESEIVSGLSAGQNVVYTRTFSGFPGRNGTRPSGAPFGSATSGT
jgi:hypothetical protein